MLRHIFLLTLLCTVTPTQVSAGGFVRPGRQGGGLQRSVASGLEKSGVARIEVFRIPVSVLFEEPVTRYRIRNQYAWRVVIKDESYIGRVLEAMNGIQYTASAGQGVDLRLAVVFFDSRGKELLALYSAAPRSTEGFVGSRRVRFTVNLLSAVEAVTLAILREDQKEW